MQTQEDRDLMERLDLAVERSSDANPEIQRMAIEVLRKEIRESTRYGSEMLATYEEATEPCCTTLIV